MAGTIGLAKWTKHPSVPRSKPLALSMHPQSGILIYPFRIVKPCPNKEETLKPDTSLTAKSQSYLCNVDPKVRIQYITYVEP